MKSLLIAFVFVFTALTGFAQGRGGYTIQGQINDLRDAQTPKTTVVTSGTATVLTGGAGPIQVLVNPASTLAAHAFTLPANPVNNQRVSLSFGGAVTTGAVVTSLTIAANTGQGILQTSAPTSGQAGNTFEYRFNALVAKWFRLL